MTCGVHMEEEILRVRMPGKGEMIGEVAELLGGSRFRVSCADGNIRLCRIPGRFRKMIKIHPGYYVIVKPWSVESDSKGDIVYIYTKTQAGWLRRKGLIK